MPSIIIAGTKLGPGDRREDVDPASPGPGLGPAGALFMQSLFLAPLPPAVPRQIGRHEVVIMFLIDDFPSAASFAQPLAASKLRPEAARQRLAKARPELFKRSFFVV